MKKRVFLGLNSAYHESAACVVVDGHLVAAAEEERFNRVRHAKKARIESAGRLPFASIDACLRLAGVSMEDVEEVGFSFLPAVRFEANTRPGVERSEEGWGGLTGETRFRDKLLELPGEMSRHYGLDLESRWSWFPHHLCHLAYSYFQSGYPAAGLLCLDGIGESECTTMGEAEGPNLRISRGIEYPDSIGMLWEKLSRFLGFTEYDACKTMSLAAFGDPAVFRSRFASLVSIREGGYHLDRSVLRLREESLDELARFLGVLPREGGNSPKQEHFDVAAALQEATEQVVLHLAETVRRESGRPRLCVAGGVALNCQANQRLCASGLFERVFIPGAANDAGTAAGAAYLLASRRGSPPGSPEPLVSSLGTSFAESACEMALRQAGCDYERIDDIESAVAELLECGRIAAWFTGRLEFGPRALGARSILADPRRREVRRRLDEEIKFREPFRPYAPSVKCDRAPEWFEIPEADEPAYFMLLACPVRPERREEIPAVVHWDGSSRVQLVSPVISPSFYRLLDEFEKLTGVPILLNTSLNSRGPIVQSPMEAIRLFQQTTLDVLVLGNLLACKEGAKRECQAKGAI